jgi:Ser/Thr protein kinase RdoA (MazF antagonist)
MLDDPATDPDLLSRIAALVGPDPAWTSLATASARVWHVRAPDRSVVVKQFRHARPFAQEHHAYTAWCPHLSEQTPRLLAASAPARALVLTHVAGDPLASLTLTPAAERTAHWHAGRFLAALHTVREPDDDASPLAAAVAQRHAAALRRVTPHLPPDAHAHLEALAAAIPGLFRDAVRVPCHRDFTPRNWLVHGPRVTAIAVLDFEHARRDTPLIDLTKLAADTWPTRPDLEEALLTGYGRDLTARERRQLRVLVAVHAMTTLAWAHAHRDPTFLALGRTALAVALAD